MKLRTAAVLTLLLFLLPPLSARAAESGVCGEHLTWTADSGTLTVSGHGPMTNFAIGNAPWDSYNETAAGDSPLAENRGIRRVVIRPGVTSIGDHAFRFCRGLTEVVIADTVTDIGTGAFSQCTDLSRLDLPPKLTSIGEFAFQACRKLSVISLPEGISRIPKSAFNLCESIVTLRIPETVTHIDDFAFSQCSSLQEIILPRNLAYLGEYAFGDCPNLKTVHFTGDVPAVGYCPFGYALNEFVDGSVSPTVYYPAGNLTWTRQVMGHFGGSPTWRSRMADVPADTYYTGAVAWAQERGITNGISPDLFGPDQPCTRGQIVTFLWRMAGMPTPDSTALPFGDVSAGDYFHSAVCWALEQEITLGTSSLTFSPDAPCTRGQIVTFLHRYAGAPSPEAGQSPFVDIARDSYCYEAILWALEQGITAGTDSTHFSPDDACTRAHAVTFLYRSR